MGGVFFFFFGFSEERVASTTAETKKEKNLNSPCFSLRVRWNSAGFLNIVALSPRIGKPMVPGGRGRSAGEGEEEEVDGEGDDAAADDDEEDRKGSTGQPPPIPPPLSRLTSPSAPGTEADVEDASSWEERGATVRGGRRPACLRRGS